MTQREWHQLEGSEHISLCRKGRYVTMRIRTWSEPHATTRTETEVQMSVEGAMEMASALVGLVDDYRKSLEGSE